VDMDWKKPFLVMLGPTHVFPIAAGRGGASRHAAESSSPGASPGSIDRIQGTTAPNFLRAGSDHVTSRRGYSTSTRLLLRHKEMSPPFLGSRSAKPRESKESGEDRIGVIGVNGRQKGDEAVPNSNSQCRDQRLQQLRGVKDSDEAAARRRRRRIVQWNRASDDGWASSVRPACAREVGETVRERSRARASASRQVQEPKLPRARGGSAGRSGSDYTDQALVGEGS
jgi:hypothetical protein